MQRIEGRAGVHSSATLEITTVHGPAVIGRGRAARCVRRPGPARSGERHDRGDRDRALDRARRSHDSATRHASASLNGEGAAVTREFACLRRCGCASAGALRSGSHGKRLSWRRREPRGFASTRARERMAETEDAGSWPYGSPRGTRPLSDLWVAEMEIEVDPPRVGIIMGSKSDMDVMDGAASVLGRARTLRAPARSSRPAARCRRRAWRRACSHRRGSRSAPS